MTAASRPGPATAPGADALGRRAAPTSPRRRFLRGFARNRGAVAGAAILLLLAVVALVGPRLVANPLAQDVPNRLRPPGPGHWFGTDEFGRDVLARVVNGAPISLASSLASVAVGLGLGLAIGLVAGYAGGKTEVGLMALVDVLLALPAILLAITIAANIGQGLPAAMIAAGFVTLPAYARLARASTLAVRRREMVDAARAIGAGDARIMTRHILPNILTPLIVQSTIGVGNAILLVSALGYLGLGAQPPTPEWGRMLSDAQRQITAAPWIGIFPGLAITLTVLGFNLAGDGLRDALDPARPR